ncbi:MAG: methyltransferase domain-containing protein [Candidatus Bathyarchaeales archaeon]
MMSLTLDVGCGKCKRGDIGIDYSRDSEADIIADACHLPFKDETFNKITSTTVLEHSPNPLNFLKEQYRVLKKRGEIEVTTDNAQYYRWSVMQLFGIRHENYHKDHYMIFFPKNVIRLMQLAGFSNISYQYLKYPRRRKMDFFVSLLIKTNLLRSACLFYRFKVKAIKY